MPEQILAFYDFGSRDYLMIRPENGSAASVTPGPKEIVLSPLSSTGIDDLHDYILRVVNLSKLPKYTGGPFVRGANESYPFDPRTGQVSITIDFQPGIYYLSVRATSRLNPDWFVDTVRPYSTIGTSLIVHDFEVVS